MAILKKKVGPKAVDEKVETSVVSEILSVNSAETVSVKIKRGGEYGSWGIELFHSKQVVDGKSSEELLDEMIDALNTKVCSYVNSLPGFEVSDPEPVEEPEMDNTPEDEPEDLTEETVRMMERKELIALIKEQEIDLDPKEYKKLADLRDVVANTLFAEESTDEADEESDDEGAVTAEMINEMERDELVALIEENELDINPNKYKKLAALAAAVIECISEEEGTTDEEGSESSEEDDEITEERILAMDREELESFIVDQEIDINPKKYKKLSLLAAAVVEALSSDDGSSEFDDTDFSDD